MSRTRRGLLDRRRRFREPPRCAPDGLGLAAGAAALAVGVLACRVDSFFFAGRPVDAYRFDEVDPALDGDLSDPHPSLVPPTLREEGRTSLGDGRDVHWVLARQAEPATTLLFSHGNGPHLGRFWDRVEVLWQLGYQVLIYDYPGFGLSAGPSDEPGVYAAAEAMLAMLAARADVDPERVVLYGHSMGGAPTLHLAAMTSRWAATLPRPQAVVTESAWCSIASMIEDASFLGLPPTLLANIRFDNCTRIAEVRGVPVMLLHGDRDRIVPARQFSLLAAAASEPPVSRIVPGANHVDVSVHGPPWPGSAPPPGVPRPSADFATWMHGIAPPR